MGVYIGTSELKNAYIGGVYEYSYDFRNSSIAAIQADGWTFPNSSTSYVDANGVRSTISDWSRLYRATPSLISNATKIVASAQVKVNGAFGVNLGIGELDANGGIRVNCSSLYGNQTRLTTGIAGTATDHSVSTIANGIHTMGWTLDLKNKTWSMSFSSVATYTGTLTDANVTLIRTNPYWGIRYAFTGFYVQTISLYIE